MSSSSSSYDIKSAEKKYKGIRCRKWGKWVTEIRVPGTSERLWLGSYATPEAAAVAHDVASYCLRGNSSKQNFNFPLILPAGARVGLSPRSVQKAASDAGMAIDARMRDDGMLTSGEEHSNWPQRSDEEENGFKASNEGGKQTGYIASVSILQSTRIKPESSFLGSVLKSAGEMSGLTSATNDSNINVDVGAQETRGSVMDKAMEYKDYTSEKAKLAADMVKVKAGDCTDYTTEKAKEEKEAVAGRMAELKENASVAARRAMYHFTGKKEEIEDDIAQEKYGKTEPEARKVMQELKLKEEGVFDEEKQRARADWDTAANRGIFARSNIYGTMGTFTDAIKDKLTYPSDIVQEARASNEYGGPKRGRGYELVDDVEEGPRAF